MELNSFNISRTLSLSALSDKNNSQFSSLRREDRDTYEKVSVYKFYWETGDLTIRKNMEEILGCTDWIPKEIF